MLSERKLFREEAFDRQGRREPIDGLLRVTAPHEWMILAGVVLALLGGLAWALFGRMEQSLSLEGVLAYRGERHAIVSQDRSRVVAVMAGAGDSVEPGQPIARMRSLEFERQTLAAQALASALAARSDDPSGPSPAASFDSSKLELPDDVIVSPYAGRIIEWNLAPGLVVEAGSVIARVLAADGREFEAVAVASPVDARRISVDMEAHVRVAGPAEGGAEWMKAEVLEVASDSASLPDWLEKRGIAQPGGRLVRLALSEARATLHDGEPCRLFIVLRRSSPADLLFSP